MTMSRMAMRRALLRKELLATLKEKTSRIILVAPIILYVVMFGYIASFNLDRVPYALLDTDRTAESADLVRSIDASPVFKRVATLINSSQAASAIDSGEAMLVVSIAQGFGKALQDGAEAPVQVIVDGRNSTTAQLAAGYIQSIASSSSDSSGVASVSSRYLYNPNNITQWFMMPGLIVMLSMMQVLSLSALSVTREREQGTFEQLLVAPFTTTELLVAKALAPICIGLLQSTAIFLIDIFWFGVKMQGSVLLLYGVLIVFILSVVGIGLAISAYSKTMQQSLILVFVAMVPMVLLSGLFASVDNMAPWVQCLTYLDPLRFALIAVRRVYLADAGLLETASAMWPVAIMAGITLPAAYHYFRKKL